MRASDIMTRNPKTVPVTWTVGEAALTMREHNLGFLPVVGEDGRCVGVLTDRDLAVRVVADGLPEETLVLDVMSSDLVAIRPDADLHKIESMFSHARVSRLVVLDKDGHVVGVLSLTDLWRHDDPARAARVFGEVTDREWRPH